MNAVLIHIGKCGGGTCTQPLAAHGVSTARTVHSRQPVAEAGASYVIFARAPLSRALSAFNWRHRLVIDEATQPERFAGERDILRHYGALDRLARALYRPDGTRNALAHGQFRAIHHLGESIAFYLDPLLLRICPGQVRGVVMQETLAADMKALFGIDLTRTVHENKSVTAPERLRLSRPARRNLNRMLIRDFACLNILYRWNKIRPEAFAHVQAEREAT